MSHIERVKRVVDQLQMPVDEAKVDEVSGYLTVYITSKIMARELNAAEAALAVAIVAQASDKALAETAAKAYLERKN